ncbi:putative Prefoldin chaperone subunit family protein [Quillaja saponaria]|uniref:Prefoldin chaperone subunit family protein n=1 Tax=Quillaja saponaria TaxID=32244 RepID=A0AAD7VF05_QUISA|nr:putative Prefoldin chaperone subunit family protein [Quillaja saponaria]
MARKKVTQKANDHNQESEETIQHQDQTQSHQAIPMEDPSEKLQALKSLNSLLLKETSERRKQVESLEQTKQKMESELTRAAMEKKVLEAEMSMVVDENSGLELEKGVISAFVETQMNEMGIQFDRLVEEKYEISLAKADIEYSLSRLSEEKEEVEHRLEMLFEEGSILQDELNKTTKRKVKLENEIRKMRVDGEKLVKEKNEKERAFQEMVRERDLAERNLTESARVIEESKGEIEGIVREKIETEKEKLQQEMKIMGLEREMKKVNEVVINLQMEKVVMSANVLKLEKSIGEAMEKEKEMGMEVRALLEENKEKKKYIEMLRHNRDGIQITLDLVEKELEDKQQRIYETIRVKNEIEQIKVGLESEIVELHKEVGELRDVIFKMKESCRDLEDKNKLLLSEANRYKVDLDNVKFGRDDMQKDFDLEKKKVTDLMLKVSQMEDGIGKTTSELGQMRNECGKLTEKNKMMDSRVEVLLNEKDLLQKSLFEAQQQSGDLKVKIESSCINSNRALIMLKNTAALVCQTKVNKDNGEEMIINEKKLEEEIQPYAEELDAIRKAFRNKNEMVEDMKQQLALLQNSVAEAHKRKSFWTVLSSATTFLAAASVAYVAKGR